MRRVVLVGLLVSAACAPLAGTQIPGAGKLQPYNTSTPSLTVPPLAAPAGPTLNIVPSPTPFNYTVKAGDTLGQIAQKFNVELDALVAANPTVNPNGMRIGETLKIPSRQKNVAGESTPTPAPFSIGQLACHPSSDGALWCFALARNDTPDIMENITAQITLFDAGGQSVGSQAALLPLDILPPGASLPLSASFPPGLPSDAQPRVQVLTAIVLLPNDPRYLDASVNNTLVQVDASGLSARVSGLVLLADDSKPAARVWVAAVAYDGAGSVVGVRRWEAGAGIQPGGTLPFSFAISSIAGEIERVDFAVEARP